MISIDSFKIRLPIDDVEILDNVLLQEVDHVVRMTGETISTEIKNKCYYDLPALKLEVTREGINFKFGTTKQIKDFITLKLTSKHLKERYLEGITSDNIEYLYTNIMQFKGVSFTLESFLSSECTDIDFKQDTQDIGNSFKPMIDYLTSRAKTSKLQGHGYRRFNEAANKGLQFSNRETTDFISNPYCKFYHKGIELTTRSKEFYDMYMPGIDVKDKVRQEVTLKNKKHLKYYKIESSKLEDLLQLDQDKLKEIMQDIVSKHIDTRRTSPKSTGETPGEMILSLLVNALIQLNYTSERIIDIITSGMTKNAKHRYRELITMILVEPGNIDQLQINDNLESLLNSFNLIS